jgi:hypothetical protein
VKPLNAIETFVLRTIVLHSAGIFASEVLHYIHELDNAEARRAGLWLNTPMDVGRIGKKLANLGLICFGERKLMQPTEAGLAHFETTWKAA